MDKYEVIKFKDNEFEMDVRVSPCENTVWLTQKQMSILFEVTTDNIGLHIRNIFKEKELDVSVAEDSSVTASDGKIYKTKIYNLDMIISVGYRVKSKRGVLFRRWANQVLKQYLLNGYVINENRVVVSNENYIELRNEVASINTRLIKLEDKVFDEQYNKHSILFNGQFYDAYMLIQSIFEEANKEIIIIDNYVDRTILDRLIVKKSNVKVIIYTHRDKSKLLNKDIEMFNKQYGDLSIRYTDKVHDRYIIIDRNKIYHLGASIKDLGKKIFSINELEYEFIVVLLTKI